LFSGATHVLVACSGGPDSQTLLSALHTLRAEHGCRLTVAAVDHGLRAEAGAELALAAQLAGALALPFVPLRVKVPARASRQAAARDARYLALQQCAHAHGAERIAVGHTLDDQAETVLARLLRGSGVEGLSAIAPARADGVVRPLIDCRRALVAAYVDELGLAVASDPSNLDPRYLRVRVRHELLPLLSRENPLLAEHLAHLADDARETAALLHERAAAALARAGRRAAVLREEPPLVRRWALKVLVEDEARTSVTRAHVTALDRMLSVGGHVRVPGDLVVSVDARGELVFERATKRGRGGERPVQAGPRLDEPSTGASPSAREPRQASPRTREPQKDRSGTS
jgi:tRNA(Ile)-lysidine synthase